MGVEEFSRTSDPDGVVAFFAALFLAVVFFAVAFLAVDLVAFFAVLFLAVVFFADGAPVALAADAVSDFFAVAEADDWSPFDEAAEDAAEPLSPPLEDEPSDAALAVVEEPDDEVDFAGVAAGVSQGSSCEFRDLAYAATPPAAAASSNSGKARPRLDFLVLFERE